MYHVLEPVQNIMRQFDSDDSHSPGELLVAQTVLINFAVAEETSNNAKLKYVNVLKPFLYRAVLEQVTGGSVYVQGQLLKRKVPCRMFASDKAAILLNPPSRWETFY